MAEQKKQWVYYFGEVGIENKGLVGGKGAGLSEMVKLDLPIPTGFTISTEACNYFSKNKKWPEGLEEQVDAALKQMEQKSGHVFGDATNPLLVSVRSGAKISMPGMMDTVLNLGLTPEICEGFAKKANPRFAKDSYRRFIQMFGDVVKGVEHHNFEHIISTIKKEKNVEFDVDLTADDLDELIKRYKEMYKKTINEDFPNNPKEQLNAAINAVFESWDNKRAITYRNLNKIPHDLGTAVNVQQMVYGNMGNDCATGVAFTRNPATGESGRFGEYLVNAQGEDVVAGIRTPLDIQKMKDDFPQCYDELLNIFERLEKHFRDMQDVEFTIEAGKLYMLQTRNGKRTAPAALKMAVNMVHEGLITEEMAVLRMEPSQIDQLLHPMFDQKVLVEKKEIAKGLPASPGAAVGTVCFTADDAVAFSEQGKKTVLVRLETSPEDIHGMAKAEGILTARGGMTSHAAVVARGMNKPCVSGCGSLQISEAKKELVIGDLTIKEGDYVSLDGSSGKVYLGQIPVMKAQVDAQFGEYLGYCDKAAKLEVLANGDTGKDAKQALEYGAKGIGLDRSEHMFFQPERILVLREMICADTVEARKVALAKLQVFQESDFYDIMSVMDNAPVVIRLLDPPLHEFLPHEEDDQKAVAEQLKINFEKLVEKVKSLHEFNPMLGFRGCRLGVVYPEISEMQIRAIFGAALKLAAEGKKPQPWVEIPLVGNVKEFLPLKALVREVAADMKCEGKFTYKVGTMIEVPRAALTAADFAKEAEFFSFGTNDLTQMTCGFSRDDSASFLGKYVEKGIYSDDPFQSIDQTGVGLLMDMCIKSARAVNPDLDIGICGEHGGEPKSIAFCHKIGLNSVSCSPFRVPIARLAAGQAALFEKGVKSH